MQALVKKRGHPGPTALTWAGKKICVEKANKAAGLFFTYFVSFDVRVVNWQVCHLVEFQSIQPPCVLKNALGDIF